MLALRVLLVWCFLVPCLVAAGGDDRDAAVEQAAAQVLKAWDDAVALSTLAKKDDPDPWVVADHLCAAGHDDAALAFASAAPRKATERLPAYVVSRRGKPAAEDVRASLRAANAALEKNDAASALKRLDGVTSTPDGVVGVRLAFGRGLALARLRRWKDSAEALERAVASAKELGWLAAQSSALYRLGMSHHGAQDFRAAAAAWQTRIGVVTALDQPDEVARMVGNIGTMHEFLGEFDKALATQRKARALFERLGNRERLARTWNSIGNLLRFTGKYKQSLEAYDRSLAMAKELNDAKGMSLALGNLAQLHQGFGNHARAMGLYEESLGISEKLDDKSGEAFALAGMGKLRLELGEPKEAVSLLRRAQDAYAKLGDRRRAAATLLSVGSAARMLGDSAEALKAYRRAGEIFEGLGDRRGVVVVLLNTANLRFVAGEYDAAVEAYEEARSQFLSMRDPLRAATALGNIALVRRKQGRYAEAIQMYELAERELADIGEEQSRTVILAQLASAQRDAGDNEQALRTARAAVERSAKSMRGLGHERQARARETWIHLIDLGLEIAVELGDAEALLFFEESGRAGSLLDSLAAGEALRANLVPVALRTEEDERRTHVQKLVSAYRAAVNSGDLDGIARAAKAVEAARAAVEETVSKIQRTAKAGAAVLYPQPSVVADIQRRLASTEAFVLFALTEKRGAALVIHRGASRVVDLGGATEIRDACDALLSVEPPFVEASQIAPLRNRVVAPLELPATASRVLISPAGRLAYVPFALLLPGRELAHQPSATVHGVLLDSRVPGAQAILALGDPVYGAGGAASSSGGRRGARTLEELAPLPHTRAEVDAIGTVRLLGTRATKAALTDALASRKRWRAVHLACHGLIDPDRPMMSSLALTADEGHDGFLTCLDIFRMRISADLSVLSACETAKGKLYRSEGLVGFTQAFFVAGSQSVLCSLWNVDDEATMALMVKFYELWGKPSGPGAAAALRKAQEFVRGHQKWEHPRYWAAWALWGLPN